MTRPKCCIILKNWTTYFGVCFILFQLFSYSHCGPSKSSGDKSKQTIPYQSLSEETNSNRVKYDSKGRMSLSDSESQRKLSSIHEIINKSPDLKKGLHDVEDAVSKITASLSGFKNTLENANRLFILTSIFRNFHALGFPIMGVTAALTLIRIGLALHDKRGFRRAIESPELQVMRAGFEQVHARFNALSEGVEELKSVVEKNSARVAVMPLVQAVENLYNRYQTILTTANPHKQERESVYFKRNFKTGYHEAGVDLWESFVDASGGAFSMKFDLLSLYQDDSNCDATFVAMMCISVQDLIIKAMIVEVFYYSLNNDTEIVNDLRETWNNRSQQLLDRCNNVTQECHTNWERFFTKKVRQIIRSRANTWTLNRKENVKDLGKYLEEYLPEWNFLVIAHKFVTHPPYLIKPSEVRQLEFLNENGNEVDIYIFASRKENFPKSNHLKQAVNYLEAQQKSLFEKIVDKKTQMRAKILNVLQQRYPMILSYVVSNQLDPEIWFSKDHMEATDVCLIRCIKVITFI